MRNTSSANPKCGLVDKLHYTLIIQGPAYGTQSAYTAYQFAHTLLKHSSHTIKTIFFYADGVYNGNTLTSPANDEFDLVNSWQALAKHYSVRLALCLSAAQRRGVTSQNVAPFFELTSLGELSESVASSDRVLQF